MDRSLYVNTLTGKHIPIVRIFLSIKTNITRGSFLYFYLAFFKLLGLLILTMSFIPVDEASYGYKVTKFLRSLTTFGIFGTSLTYSAYTLTSYLFFIFLFGSLVLFIYTYKMTKIQEDYIISSNAKILCFVLEIIFQMLLVFSQHLLEYFSFIFIIVFNSGVNLSKSPFYCLIKDYSIFMNFSITFDTYILILFNFLGIIFLNVFMYFAFKLLNEPFLDSDFPVRMRFSNFSMIMYVIFQNLQCIHYVELFIIDLNTLKFYKFFLLAVVNFVLLIGFTNTYNSFNFSGRLAYLINYILNLSFFSSIIEISLYFSDFYLESTKLLIFTIICKLLISLAFVSIIYHFNEKNFITTLKTSLFKSYEGKIEKNDLESLFYVINLLIELEKTNIDSLDTLMNIIISHKTECVNDSCKCTSIKEYTLEILIKEINQILESIFVNLNLGKEHFVNVLFAEYLYYQRKSTFFSWSIINTFISKNTKNASSIIIYQLFLNLMKKVYKFDDEMKTTEHYLHFNEVFREKGRAKFYEKKIVAFVDNFENILKFKERFDSSIKVDHNEGKIDSYIFGTEMSQLTDNLKTYQILYKNMKSHIKNDYGVVRCKSIELGYRLYAFFNIFNKKVPKYILGMICEDSTLDKTSNTAVCNYFNESFKKFFLNNKAPMNMIIEINKIFRIKYINNKICETLGHPYSKLINDDIHLLFPLQYREPHKNVLLNKFLIEKYLFFRKKTFGFTSSNNLVPLDIMVSCFPNLKKNLQAVISVYPVETDDRRAFFFVITEFNELLAVSENLDSIYSLNYEIIDKLRIDLMKLLDIENVIATKFKPHLENIKKERYMKQFNHLHSLSNFLFSLGGEDERPTTVQQALPNRHGENAKKQSESFNGGNKATGSQKNIGKIDKNLKESEIYSKKGSDYGNLDNEELQKKDNSSSISPEGEQNNLVDKQLKGPLSEKFSKAYTNYLKEEKDTPSNDGKISHNLQTPLKQDKFSEDVNVIRDKKQIIRNLEIINNRCKDFETGFQYYEKLSVCISKLKKSCGINEDKTVETSKPNLIRDKFKTNNTTKSSAYSENFHITISFRKINDSPFFLVGVKEKMIYKMDKYTPGQKNNLNKNLTVIGETPEETNQIETQQSINSNNTPNSLKNKFGNKKESKVVDNDSSLKTESENVLPKQNNFKESVNKETNGIQITKKKKEEDIFNDPNGIISISAEKKKKISAVILSEEKLKKQEALKIREKNQELIMTVILGIFLVANLILAILVFYYKLFVIQVTEDIFIVNFWRMRHETILTALHSACLTYAFLLTNVTTFQTKYLNSVDVNVPVTALPSIIDERSSIVRDTFAHFFAAAKSSRYKLDGLEYLLYTNVDTYKSMVLTWEPFQYNSTYVNLIDFIVTKSKELTIETKLDDYITDINNALLFKQYNNMKFSKAYSKHSVLLYFLNENIQKLEEIFIQFKNAINKSETDFKDSIRTMTSTIEIMNIVLGFILILMIHYTLTKFDKNLFKTLLSMFLNMRKGKKENFKGSFECQLVKLQITNLKNLLYSFKVENIKKLDQSLNIDEFGINKLLLKNFFKNDESSLGILLGNSSVDTSAPSKSPLLDATLGGSLLGLNSSQSPLTPLAASNSTKKLGINEVKNEENSRDSGETPGSSNDQNKNGEKIDDKKLAPKRKKKQQKDEGESEDAVSIITNGQILKKTKHYSIKFVFIAKIVITLVFLVYIIFIISNVIENTINFNLIDSNMALVSSYVMVFPEINRIFNMIRLSIITNELTYTSNLSFYTDAYYQAEADSTILEDQFQDKLPESYSYYKTLNSLDYENRSAFVCKGTVVKDFCKVVLKKENGYNKEGLKIATHTVIQTIIDIYKDYVKIRNAQSSQSSFLTSNSLLLKYFKTEDFGNVNCQMCLVFLPTTISYFNSIQSDMSEIFKDVINMNEILGIISICLNIIIILYIILIFFRRLKESKGYITYSANKFNKALFEA